MGEGGARARLFGAFRWIRGRSEVLFGFRIRPSRFHLFRRVCQSLLRRLYLVSIILLAPWRKAHRNETVGWYSLTSQRIRNRFMQFKLDLLQPVGNIRIIHTLHKDGPAMRMIHWSSLWLRIAYWIEGSGCCAVDEGAKGLNTLDSLLSIAWRRHGLYDLWC